MIAQSLRRSSLQPRPRPQAAASSDTSQIVFVPRDVVAYGCVWKLLCGTTVTPEELFEARV